MPYAHKLDVYEDAPHKKVIFCSICGKDETETDLKGACAGEYQMSDKEQAIFDKQFREIFECKAIDKYRKAV